MDEKKLLDLIKDSASDLTPPDSLSPEEIEKRLIRTQNQQKNRKKRLYFTRFAATAAAAAFCITAAWQVNHIQKTSKDLELQNITFSRPQDAATEKESENIALQETPEADTIGYATADTSASDAETDSAETAYNDADDAVTNDIADAEAANETPVNTDLTPASSYEEVFDALHEQFYYDEFSFYPALGAKSDVDEIEYGASDTGEIMPEDTIDMSSQTVSEDADMGYSSRAENSYTSGTAAESADMDVAAAESADEVSGYSTTNVQELGVDEADIVKTDGNYIYILRQNGSVTIVRADPESMETVASISSADTAITSVQEMYLDGDTLSIVANRYGTTLRQEDDTYYTSDINQTALYTYDISDRSAPVLTGTVVQDGSYRTSRKVDNYIYLFTSYYPDIRATYEESIIVPLVNNSRLDASDFYLPEHPGSPAYLVISSMDISRPGKILDKKALVSGVSNFYVSTENIYIANEDYSGDTTITKLTKFSYKDGIITGIAAGAVKGYLNNSFSMNEYDGYLRVVSTYYNDNWEERNALYILDKSLKLTGSIENLAEGETIRSARFFGDTGYFVTFRQTDPLFSVDLSDPSRPRILGELKVSGFSSYLHFYGENLLLGMGYEADETTGEIYGVKLSMFDITDPSDVKELHRVVVPDVTWCPSLDNYKSILIDPEKNLFGFFCGERYLVFSYDEKAGFVSQLVYDLVADAISRQTGASDSEGNADFEISQTDSYGLDENMLTDSIDIDAEDIIYDSSWYTSMNSYNSRGLYINDTFYLAGDASVTAFDMTDGFSKIGTLVFNK